MNPVSFVDEEDLLGGAQATDPKFDVVGYRVGTEPYCLPCANGRWSPHCRCAPEDRDENGVCLSGCDGVVVDPIYRGELGWPEVSCAGCGAIVKEAS